MSYVVKPTQGELASARASVEGVFEACTQRLPSDQSVSVALGWSDDPVVVEWLGGADGVCWGPDSVEVVFSSRGEAWTDAVSGMASRVYGRAWVRGQLPDEQRSFWWQDIIEGAAGERLAAAVAPSYSPPWVDVDPGWETVWPVVEPRLGESIDAPFVEPDAGLTGELEDSELRVEFLPEAVAAALDAALGEEYALEEFPELTRSTVVDALDSSFGET